LNGLNSIPYLNVLRQLDKRVNRGDGANPVLVAHLFGNRAIFLVGNFEEVRCSLRVGVPSAPVVMPEGGHLPIANGNLGRGSGKSHVGVVTG
jgi:hypothetical protein